MKIDREGNVTPFIIDENLKNPHHLSIDSEGNIYTASDNDGIIWKITPDKEMTTTYPQTQDRKNLFVGLWGDPFTIDNAGNFYCVASNKIWRIDEQGDYIPLAPDIKGNLHFAGMSWGNDSFLYISNKDKIQKISPSGLLEELDFQMDLGIELGVGIAVDPDSNIFIADHVGQKVIRITADGEASVVLELSALMNEINYFMPSGIAFGLTGEIYILDSARRNTRVWEISNKGSVVMLASIAY